jgi:hypothetical protein
MPFLRFNLVDVTRNPSLGRMHAAVWNQPSWARRWAMAAAALVIVVPIALLLLLAAIAFVVVLVVCGVAFKIGRAVGPLLGPRTPRPTMPQNGGRRNVRVVQLDQPRL